MVGDVNPPIGLSPESILAERCMHMREDPESESEVKVTQMCPDFAIPWAVFSRPECWSG